MAVAVGGALATGAAAAGDGAAGVVSDVNGGDVEGPPVVAGGGTSAGAGSGDGADGEAGPPQATRTMAIAGRGLRRLRAPRTASHFTECLVSSTHDADGQTPGPSRSWSVALVPVADANTEDSRFWWQRTRSPFTRVPGPRRISTCSSNRCGLTRGCPPPSYVAVEAMRPEHHRAARRGSVAHRYALALRLRHVRRSLAWTRRRSLRPCEDTLSRTERTHRGEVALRPRSGRRRTCGWSRGWKRALRTTRSWSKPYACPRLRGSGRSRP